MTSNHPTKPTLIHLDSAVIRNVIQAELTHLATKLVGLILAAQGDAQAPTEDSKPAKSAPKPPAPKAAPSFGQASAELLAQFKAGTEVTNHQGKTGTVTVSKDGPTVRSTTHGPQVFVKYPAAPCPMWVLVTHLTGTPVTAAPPVDKPKAKKAPAKKSPEAPKAETPAAPAPETPAPTVAEPVKPRDGLGEDENLVLKDGKWFKRVKGKLVAVDGPEMTAKNGVNGAVTQQALFIPGLLIKPVKKGRKSATARIVEVREGGKLLIETEGGKQPLETDAALWQVA
jgi:hypothetical protein